MKQPTNLKSGDAMLARQKSVQKKSTSNALSSDTIEAKVSGSVHSNSGTIVMPLETPSHKGLSVTLAGQTDFAGVVGGDDAPMGKLVKSVSLKAGSTTSPNKVASQSDSKVMLTATTQSSARHDQSDFETLRTELRAQFILNQEYKRMLVNGSRNIGLKQQVGDMLRALRHALTKGPKRSLNEVRDIRSLRASPLFDPAFYRATAGIDDRTDPVRHYYYNGSRSGLDPSSLFSGARYLNRHSDVAAANKEPLSHFLCNGLKEGRDPALSAANLTTEIGQFASGSGQTGKAEWAVLRRPKMLDTDLQKYDFRPDDDVPREADIGERFGAVHKLFSAKPSFQTAIDEIAQGLGGSVETVNPVVSIIIPVYGQLAYTLNVLHSLSLHKSKYSFEIIVGDDCSPDETEAFLQDLEGIQFVRHPENGGFILNCNKAAKYAKGQYIVLLNNDTRVVNGWLDGLIDSFSIFPKAGLVGSKLFYPDSSLQEAGGIIWSDGSGWNYGRNDDPNRPEYCYARQVDYISGASIATPLALWEKLGGFDERYCPAYYEDSDYAFRIREAGYETWFQPVSRVIHYEGKTSGTDTNVGAKAYQIKNASKFVERWEHVLAGHSKNGWKPAQEKDRYSPRRVLVVDATAPTPDQDAGSVTAIKVMQVFQGLGYQVTFVPADNFLYQRRYVDDLHRMGVECIYAPYATSLHAHLIAGAVDYDVVHVFRHMVMDKAISDIRGHLPRAKVMFNNMDLHYLRIHRQGVIEGNAKLVRFAAASKPHEIQTMRTADYVFVPSSVEKDLLSVETGLPPLEVMPFMVDPQEPLKRENVPADIIFLGGFDHSPNGDAVEWFMENVWPSLEADKRIRRFVIVGAKPSERIKAMGTDRVIVTGRVEDLEPVFAQARAMVVPLRYGAGVKGKIYTALAYGVPVITTAVGAEGIVGLQPGKDVLMAETPEDFIAAIHSVFENEAVFQGFCQQGPVFIDEFATLRAGRRAMIEALTQLGLNPEAIAKTKVTKATKVKAKPKAKVPSLETAEDASQ